MEDLNDVLLRTTTASADGGQASGQWLHARKKRRRSGDLTNSGTSGLTSSFSLAPSSESSAGIDVAHLQQEILKEQHDAAARLLSGTATARAEMEKAGQHIAAAVLEYVMQRELGGRQNAGKAGEGPCVAPAGRLNAERARLTRAAGYNIVHVVEYGTGVPARAQLHAEAALPGVVEYRKALCVCDQEIDLVGGYTAAGLAPHTRRHQLGVIWSGLTGEAMVRTEAKELESAAGMDEEAEKVAAVDLFASTAGTEADTGGERNEKGFSLDHFLAGSSSDSDE